MQIQLLLFCGMFGWLLVIYKAFVLHQSDATSNRLAHRRPRNVGLLWLIQAIHLLLWAYRQTWWLVAIITKRGAPSTFTHPPQSLRALPLFPT